MWPCRDENNPQPSDRLQILDQIRFLLLGQGCLKVIVVVIDYVGERRKSSIVVKAACQGPYVGVLCPPLVEASCRSVCQQTWPYDGPVEPNQRL